MPRIYQAAVVATAFGAVLLAGCSSNSASPSQTPVVKQPRPSQPAQTSPSPAPSAADSSLSPTPTASEPTAMQLAKQVKSKISEVHKIVHITEDNDPNNLIGRPNGYVDGAVLYIDGAPKDDFGVDEGAFIEIWPNESAATARGKYIQKVTQGIPALGEYDEVRGRALLRVAGAIKPSYEKKIKNAFES